MPLVPTIWTTSSPATWAQAPEWMNFHFLLEAERCPKAAALRHAEYPQIWTKHGYPDKPHASAITGRIVHASVERIARELALDHCVRLQDPKAIEVLKKMGGYSTVISQFTESVLATFADNPRYIPVSDTISSIVRSRVPQIREQIQVLLSRLVWSGGAGPVIEVNGSTTESPTSTRRQSPLPLGTHFEVELRDEALRWKGFADLIEVQGSDVAIVDFKTGDKSDVHELQIRIYALLWLRDAELNPAATPAAKLILSYPRGDEVLPGITQAQANELAAELKTRTDRVRESLHAEKLKANLSAEHCGKCQVRHLCPEYWTPMRQKAAPRANGKQMYFDDVELVITQRRGDTVWDAMCSTSDLLLPSAKVMVRIQPIASVIEDQLIPGTRIRLTDALVSIRDGDTPLVHMMNSTEVLVAPPSA
jgi:CRISPR/Cas system-associated exonuclease Cas4 (RecB family)